MTMWDWVLLSDWSGGVDVCIFFFFFFFPFNKLRKSSELRCLCEKLYLERERYAGKRTAGCYNASDYSPSGTFHSTKSNCK